MKLMLVHIFYCATEQFYAHPSNLPSLISTILNNYSLSYMVCIMLLLLNRWITLLLSSINISATLTESHIELPWQNEYVT